MGILRNYFSTPKSPSLDHIRSNLWRSTNVKDDAASTMVLLEQYKLYVEMADRISARRGIANTYFLTLNTTIATVIGIFWNRPPGLSFLFPFICWLALIGQCLAWFWILRSYRQLNTAKYSVIGALEERLPSSPYWRAEWIALGESSDPHKYWPLSHVEAFVPVFFAAVYSIGLIALIAA